MAFLPSFDHKLVGRIKKYMKEHRKISVDEMTEDLREIYRNEYGRRKRNVFGKLVEKVYNSLVEGNKKANLPTLEQRHLSKRRKENSEISSSGSSSDEELAEEYQDVNFMNSSVTNLYNKQMKRHSQSLPSSPYSYTESNFPTHRKKDKSATKILKSSSSAVHKVEQIEVDINGNDTEHSARNEQDFDDIEMKKDFVFIESDPEISMNSKRTQISTNLRANNEKIQTELVDSGKGKKRNSSKLKDSKSKKRKGKKKNDEEGDIDIKGAEKEPKFNLQSSNVKFEDIGGNEKTLSEVCKLLIHMRHPEIYKSLGVVPPCGVLLHGPPGCGKSLLANAIAGELGLPMLKLAATEIVSGVSGESEQKLRDVFEMALGSAPCIVFIDEIDAITPKREIASKDMERRIVAQLLSCMDDLNSSPSQILIIGATNRPDSIDPALRRAGRFDREISMGIPDEKAREEIMRVLCRNLKLHTEFNFSMLARLTPGYVGADLMSLCREAAMCAVNRIISKLHRAEQFLLEKAELENEESQKSESTMTSESEHSPQPMKSSEISINFQENQNYDQKTTEIEQITKQEQIPMDVSSPADEPTVTFEELPTSDLLSWLRKTTSLSEEDLNDLFINFEDFEHALPLVQPSAKREGFATVPDVTWDDIGALEDVRDELTVAILAPVRNPRAFAALGLTKPPGILLAGPPGCGKTLLAKAIANESGINFISVKGPELLNMYVGESERAVRQCFERARSSSPCVIFFDELDSLCPRRSGAESNSTARVVNQMLTEMDGLETRKQVYVMAATNRPDIIDPAVLRPGRLDKTLYISLPTPTDRLKILETITRNGTKPPLSKDVSLESIAKDERCSRFTGADLSSLVREAAVNALREHLSTKHVLGDGTDIEKLKIEVKLENFEKAFSKVKPSISRKDEFKYDQMKAEIEGVN